MRLICKHPFIFLTAILILAAFTCVFIGAYQISIADFIAANLNEQQSLVFYSIRLPRILLAIIVGLSLAAAGASMQSLFRNPLSDPGLIGISSGAAFFVAIAIVVFPHLLAGKYGLYALNIFAFCGGILTAILIFYFAKISGSFSVTYMLLAGIAINSLAGASIGFLTYLSDDEQLRSLVFWTMGNLSGAIWPEVIITGTITIPALVVLIKNSAKLNLLLLGDDNASYLGVDIIKLKKIIIICCSLLVGSAVSVSGVIGFVGLVVPHLVRLSLGSDHRLLFPASALLGASLLLIADTLARSVVSPAEMPVGILTSIIGAPFFLLLIIKQNTKRFGL